MQTDPRSSTSGGSELGALLADEEYLRVRVAPAMGHVNYLCFQDLLRVVTRFAQQVKGTVFDYGCGGAPYRELFRHCAGYVGADITPGPRVDRLLSADGLTQEADNRYDAVFSAQVLEHVRNPDAYVRECFRILRPGGRLFVSTHGMFQEHGCPYDFHRWTCRGLEELIRENGLGVLDSGKMTTELRAVVQLAHHLVLHLRHEDKPFIHYPLAIFRKAYGWLLMPILNALASAFPGQAVTSSDSPASLYVGVFVFAEKKLAP